MSYNGRSVPMVVPTKDGGITFKVSNAYNLNRVGKVDEVAQIADIYDYSVIGDNCTVVQYVFTAQKIKIVQFRPVELTKINLDGYFGDIAKDLTPDFEHEIPNGLGRIPVFEFTNQIIPRLASNVSIRWYPDCLGVWPLISQVQDIIQKKVNERALNHTRILGESTPSDFIKFNTNKDNGEITQEVMDILHMGYIGNSARSLLTKGGMSQTGFEVSIGDPKFDQFNNDLDIQLKLLYNGAGYDWDGFDGNYTNKAESLQNNKNDLETAVWKRGILKNGLYNVFDFALIFTGKWDGSGERPYSFDFVDNTFAGQTKNVDMMEKLIKLGAVSRSFAIKKIFGLTQKQADEIVQKANEDSYEKSLYSVSVEDNDNDGDNQDTKNAKNVNGENGAML